MSRKIPTEMKEQIAFAEAIIRSSQLTLSGFEHRLTELADDRAAIDRREEQIRKDVAAAPGLIERGRERLNRLMQAKRSLNAACGVGRTADPEKKRARLEAKVQRHAKLAAQLEKLQEEIEQEESTNV